MKAKIKEKVEQINMFNILEQGFQLSINKNRFLDSLKPNKKAKVLEKYEEEVKFLKNRYETHKKILSVGSSDMFHADGMNLYLVRNHIINTKKQLKEFNETYGLELPNEYYLDVPEEYPMEYNSPGSSSGRVSYSPIRTYTDEELKLWRENRAKANLIN